MDSTKQTAIININHARNRISEVIMRVDDIDIMQELSEVSATLFDTINNIKCIGA